MLRTSYRDFTPPSVGTTVLLPERARLTDSTQMLVPTMVLPQPEQRDATPSLMERFLRSEFPVVLTTVLAFAMILVALLLVVLLDSQLVTVLLALVIGGWLWFMFRVAL